MHMLKGVHRKLALILAAVILPGGFIALFAAMLWKALTQTPRGRKVVEVARKRVSGLHAFGASVFGERQPA
jgi:hypothetical protein